MQEIAYRNRRSLPQSASHGVRICEGLLRGFTVVAILSIVRGCCVSRGRETLMTCGGRPAGLLSSGYIAADGECIRGMGVTINVHIVTSHKHLILVSTGVCAHVLWGSWLSPEHPWVDFDLFLAASKLSDMESWKDQTTCRLGEGGGVRRMCSRD